MRRSRGVVAELHAELALALSGSAQLGAEAKHGVQTAVADEGEVLTANIGVVNGGVTLVHEHQNVALELVGGGDGGLHQGLEDLATSIVESLSESHLGGQVEGVIGRISNVGGTIIDNHLGTNNLVAQERTLLTSNIETLGTSRQELVGDVTTNDLRLVVVLIRLVVRLDPTSNTGKVTRTTALSLQQEIVVSLASNGLAVGNTGLAGDTLGLVLSLETLDVNLKVQFTHTRNDGLLTLGVDVDSEGRILALESVHGLTEVVGVTSSLGLDGERHDGIRDEHGRHSVGETAISEGVTGGTVNAKDGTDLTGTDLRDIFHLVGVHADNTGNPDLLIGSGVEQVGTLGELALVDSDVGELAVVVLLKLEGKTDKGQRVVGNKLHSLLLVGLVQTGVLDISGVGQEIADSVEHGLNTLIGKGRAHHDGGESSGNGGAADGILDLLVGGLLLVEVQFGNLIVDIGKLLNKGLALLLNKLLEGSRNLIGDANLGATGTLKVNSLHVDKIDDALELVLSTNGNLDSSGGNLELGVDLLDGLPGVGTHSVHLVDEGDSGDIITLHLTVDSDGLRLDAANSAQNHDSTVEDSESSLDLNGEIDMTRGINQVEVVGFLFAVFRFLPVGEGGRRLDGDAFFPLEFHGVHLGADGILASHLVDRIDSAGVEQNSLTDGSLSTVDVRLSNWVSEGGDSARDIMLIQQYRCYGLETGAWPPRGPCWQRHTRVSSSQHPPGPS